VIDHQLPGNGPGHVRAEILFDHSQREIDPRGHPGQISVKTNAGAAGAVPAAWSAPRGQLAK